MKQHSVYPVIAVCIVLLFEDCKKAYSPEIKAESGDVLVVEGILNVGNDSTFISLSRTVALDKGRGINPESNATVSIEAEDGIIYYLTETSKGIYAAPSLNINPLVKHRLHIKTSGQEYVSDYVEAKITPEIKNLGFKIDREKVNVTVNTNDPTNNTRYYRWTYDQDWEFNANFDSRFKSVNGEVIDRPYTEFIYHCWNNEKASNIVLGSTAKLSQDIIKDKVILSMPGTSEKLSIKYSILVKQYALTKGAFDFWQNMKRNTEQLGTIFDPQPSLTKGNIYSSSNPDEFVIGYFSASSITSKRLFIDKSSLLNFRSVPFYTDCLEDSIKLQDVERAFKFEWIPYVPIRKFTIDDKFAGYMGSSRRCVDCTLRGTTRKPDFWE